MPCDTFTSTGPTAQLFICSQCRSACFSGRVKHDFRHVTCGKLAPKRSLQHTACLAILLLLGAVALMRTADVRKPLLLLPVEHPINSSHLSLQMYVTLLQTLNASWAVNRKQFFVALFYTEEGCWQLLQWHLDRNYSAHDSVARQHVPACTYVKGRTELASRASRRYQSIKNNRSP